MKLDDPDFLSLMTGLGAGLVMLAAAWVADRRRRRREEDAPRGQLRFPAAMLVLHGLVVGLRETMPAPAMDEKLSLLALFVLLVSVTRSGLIVVLDGALGSIQKVPDILRDITWFALLFLCAMATLGRAGADLGSLLTTSALITAVLGLAMQETLGNLVAGLAMQARPPFQPGDWIDVGGQLGMVREFNWRATHLRTQDETEIVVPNGQLARANIVNISRPVPLLRRNIRFQGPYEVPPGRVIELVLAGLADIPGVLVQPAPSVLVERYDQSGVEYWIRVFIEDIPNRDAIDSAVRVRVWYLLARAGINIPYPTRTLLIPPAPPANAAEIELDRRVSALAQVDVFAVVPRAQLRGLAAEAKVEHYCSGEAVVRQGDPGEDLYVVVAGSLEVLVHQASGTERSISDLGPGGLFGEISALGGSARAATVRARSTSELLAVPRDALQALVQADPALLEALSVRLVRRQAEIASHIQGGHDTIGPDEAGPDLLDRIRAIFTRSTS